jgi:hypothetical protein
LSSEITFIDGNARPDTSEQFVLGDDLARALNQNDQEVECTNADVNRRISFKQEMRRGRQAKWPKPNCAITRRLNIALSLQSVSSLTSGKQPQLGR